MSADHRNNPQPDTLLLKAIRNYTDALNRISLEQSNPDDFDKHLKAIEAETVRAIRQHYTPNTLIDQERRKARIDEHTLAAHKHLDLTDISFNVWSDERLRELKKLKGDK